MRIFTNTPLALRTLFRDKAYSALNILGLVVGMTSVIFISLYVIYEMNYDNFHTDRNRIYRVVRGLRNDDGTSTSFATTPPILSNLLKSELPEIESAVRVFPTNGRQTVFQYNDLSFYEGKMYDSDSTIFNVFTFPFLKGNARSALKHPEDIVITESTAKKYFGNDEPLGKTLVVEDQYLGKKELTVTAVVQDVPFNAHFRFDFLRPATFMIWPQNLDESWGFVAFHTYIKLKEKANIDEVERKIQETVQRHNPENKGRYSLQRLSDIHLHSHLQSEILVNGDIKTIIVLITLAAFIMIVASINYVNFSIARAIGRAREVAIRKVTGALKRNLIKQFAGESVLIAFVALLLALLLVILLLPSFNQLMDKHFAFSLKHYPVWLCIVSITLLAGILPAIYPALYLSSFSPIKVLRGSATDGRHSWSLRNILLATQFIASILLICCAMIISRQMRFILSAPLGFHPEHVLVIPDVNKQVDHEALKHKFKELNDVLSVGSSSGMIEHNNWKGKMRSSITGKEIPVAICNIDTSFFRTIGITVLQSGMISSTDSVGGIVLNETAVKELGFTEPIGEKIFWPNDLRPLKVVGVVKDFHFESLHEEITPFAFQFLDHFNSNFFVRLQTTDLQNTIHSIESTWKNVAPNHPFRYYFLDQHVENQYQAEAKIKAIVFIASFVAALIALTGLLGLSALTVKTRLREIGVRKVLGASTLNILSLLSRNVLVILIVSTVVAMPLVYWIMDLWLTRFAYRISLSENIWYFIAPPFVLLSTAMAALNLLALRAAHTNPVDVLRSE